ncbi:hypothetical protein M2322_002689 [Rhodoblastus acidophilus]|uniref:hypothetical protein n=1 Tax=Rhodoblastus acidophilus TaxID=1074 RepID=UPI0022240D04|nr:hypothetical protein [Rhodoblastus acidophilus]MCW2317135.1 hypothetical protein [Rhodoblastus acidophilus]
MNQYTDARSRPGAKEASGSDDRQLFLIEFGGMVIQAYDEVMDYQDLRFLKSITQGKADSFPIIGRKRDATEHNPGDLILGGSITHDEVQIALDNMLVDAVFIAEIDTLMAHYDLAAPYAHQLGQSLGSATAFRIAIMHIIASRSGQTQGAGANPRYDAPVDAQPIPAYYWDANLKTDASKLENAAFLAAQYLRENDMSGQEQFYMLPHQQVLLMARYTGVEGGPVTTGSGNRAEGTIGKVAGLQPRGTNHIPNTNITTGITKYQGNFSATVGHIGNKMAVGTLERRAMKVVMKQQDERLGTLLIASMFNGHGPLRNECSIELSNNSDAGVGISTNGRTLLA